MPRPLSFVSVVFTSLLLLALTAAAVDTFTMTAARAIVRAKPALIHPLLTVVPHGAISPVLETQAECNKILVEDGREGWITRQVGRVEQERGRPTPLPHHRRRFPSRRTAERW